MATCKAIKLGEKPVKENVGADHEYERLALEAKLAGKFDKTIQSKHDLKKVALSLKKRVEELGIALPLLYPRKELLGQNI